MGIAAAARKLRAAKRYPMPPSPGAVPGTAHRYRLPSLLEDIRLLDLLELSGSTQEVSHLVRLSQPTVSRRTRMLAREFGLGPPRRRRLGTSFGTTPAMRLLRLSCRAHRLMAGVARLGADVLLQPLLAGPSWLLPAPSRFRATEDWLELVRQGVLDGALVSGLEAGGPGLHDPRELEVLRLGNLPMVLAMDPASAARNRSSPPSVLVPPRGVAGGLQRALAQRGLRLKTAGSRCQTPSQWRQRLADADLAMPLPALDPADWWQPLRQNPLPQGLPLPLWLVLPTGWEREPVLAHTVGQLGTALALVRPGEACRP
jgi:hypothetical protein